jgi:hypothetical protein
LSIPVSILGQEFSGESEKSYEAVGGVKCTIPGETAVNNPPDTCDLPGMPDCYTDSVKSSPGESWEGSKTII